MQFDFNTIANFFSTNSTGAIIYQLFVLFGWILMFWVFAFLVVYYLEEYKEEKYKENWEWVLLAVDIPALNVQTPKAVEQMFAHIAGVYESPNLAERFRQGYKQRWFSFEVVSIEGYIQFLVRTEAKFRDLVEASIYAQYPEAEIIEVEDYTKDIPAEYPNDTHDVWMGDFGLAESDAFPIRSYTEFEHSISKDTVLKDPMGTFLESFSRIGPGEQMWFQILLQPTGNSWKEKSIKKIKEFIGEETKSSSSSPVDLLTDNLLADEITKGLAEIGAQLSGGGVAEASGSSKDSDSGEPNKLRYMTPGQVKLVEAMENKIAKIGFKTKIRGGYVARKEVFRPERGVQAMIGAINQFNIPSSNSIVPKYTVSTSYALKDKRVSYRKKLLVKAFKKRKINSGGSPFIMNIEELATIWHFPMSHVQTPLIQKAQGKRAEPPPGLPIEGVVAPVAEEEAEEKETPTSGKYRTDSGDMVGYGDTVKFG